MKIAVAKEIDPSEPRVAASPDTVKKFKALGVEIAVEPGAGIKSGLPDSEFAAAGATVSADALKDADIVIKLELTAYAKSCDAISNLNQAARTEFRNLPTSSLRRLLSLDKDCAADSTCEEAKPVSLAPRCTSAILELTCVVPCAAC